jgi:hypothetical protein
MAILLMLGWWYTTGWLWVARQTGRRLHELQHTFAVGVLLKTLFSPWKQIYNPSSSFSTFFRDMIDNTVSRGIGAVVRSCILFWVFLLSILIITAGVISFVLWPVLPLLTVLFPFLMVAGQ